jgi:hypothetical protein
MDILPEVKKADREALVKAKLVGVSKQGNSFLLRLEDDGWAWASAHLRAAVPPAYQVLQAFLLRLDEHLHNADITLADFIGLAPEMPEKKPKPKTRSKTSKAQATSQLNTDHAKIKITAQKPKERAAKGRASAESKTSARKKKSVVPPKPPIALDAAKVRREIEQAYLKVTNGRKGVDAKLSDVRAYLSHLDRATVDIGLGAILRVDNKARLMRMDNNRGITAADSEAAFHFAGEPFHILWIMQ